jgi:hypothetical protein
MKPTLRLLLVLFITISPALAKKKPPETCNVNFAFVYIDHLDNTYRGLQGKELKQVQHKLTNYGDVCYTPDESKAEYIFFVHTRPAVYHGVHTSSETNTHTDSNPVSGTVTDENGNVSTINGTVDTTTRTTTTTSTPYELDYSVFILDILVPHQQRGSAERTFVRLHTFDQKGLYHTLYGIGYGKGKHPIVNVIDTAAKWLHENNLGK